MLKKVPLILCLLLLPASTAQAVTIFGLDFAETAFGDDATHIKGDVLFFGFSDAGIPLSSDFDTNLDVALTGSNLYTMIEGDTTAQNPYVVEISFLDNYLFNGPSSDLAIYERGLAEGFGVSVFDSRVNDFTAVVNLLPTKVGDLVGSVEVSSGVNLAEVNFSSWNLPADLSVTRIRLYGRAADIAVIGGLNSRPLPQTAVIPEPSTLFLMFIGLVGMMGWWK